MTDPSALEIADRMEDTYRVCGDIWFKRAALALRAQSDVRAPAPQGEPVLFVDLSEVLANTRTGISQLRSRNSYIPIEIHRACLALTHIVEGSRS